MRIISAVALSFMLVVGSSAAKAAPLELNLVTMWPEIQNQMVEVVFPWAKKIEQATNGEIKINVFAGGTLVDATENSKAVESGMADLAIWTPDAQEHPNMFLTQAPYMGKSLRNITDIIRELIKQVPALNKEVQGPGVFLGFSTSAPYVIASVNTPIRNPEDLQGKRVLVVTPAQAPMIESWGGQPIYVAQGDVYIGLQRGMGEAYVSGASNVRGLRIMEVAKYMTQPGFPQGGGFYFSMNRETFAELSPEHQKLFMELGAAMMDDICESFVKDYQISVDSYIAAGAQMVDISPETMEKWRTATIAPLRAVQERLTEQAGLKNPGAITDEYYKIAATVSFRQ